jgi:hypothetical protein
MSGAMPKAWSGPYNSDKGHVDPTFYGMSRLRKLDSDQSQTRLENRAYASTYVIGMSTSR